MLLGRQSGRAFHFHLHFHFLTIDDILKAILLLEFLIKLLSTALHLVHFEILR